MSEKDIILDEEPSAGSDSNENSDSEPIGEKAYIKRVRVGEASVHSEFVQWKEGKVWSSKCKHCIVKEKVYKHKNCSSLMKHLQIHHKEVYDSCIEKDKNERTLRQNTTKASNVLKGKSSVGHTKSGQVLVPSQTTGPLSKFLNLKQNCPPINEQKQQLITKKFALWLGSSGLPISAVTEDENFVSFISEINPDLNLPKRTTITKVCKSLSKDVADRIREALKQANVVHTTTDIWSSKNCKHSYLGVTVHLYNKITEKRENYRIACREFDIAHTGKNIATLLTSIFEEFGIESKVMYTISDNGSNMKKALQLMKEDDLYDESEDNAWDDWEERDDVDMDMNEDSDSDEFNEIQNNDIDVDVTECFDELESQQRDHRVAFSTVGIERLPCFPHTMQCAILKSSKRSSFNQMLRKTRRLAVKYRCSGKAKAILQKTQFKKRLLGYCKTRWWTDYDMIVRMNEAMVVEQIPKPLDFLIDAMDWPNSMILTDRDHGYMAAYMDIMGLIKTKTDELGSENLSTIHLVIPSLYEIIAHLRESATKPFKKKFASDLEENIKDYFGYVLDHQHPRFDPVFVTATYLSPIHRNILSRSDILRAEDYIKEQLVKYDEPSSSSLEDANSDNGIIPPVDHEGQTDRSYQSVSIPGLEFLSQQIFSKVASVSDSEDNLLKSDISYYDLRSKQVLEKLVKSAQEIEMGGKKTKAPIDPMDFWIKEKKNNKYRTNVAKLALDLMAIPASSVPSERLFSISGLLSSGTT